MKTGPIFYVYEHWRPDKDVCFYVGKGHGKRAWEARRRNRYYENVAKKLSRLGMCVEVRLVGSGLLELKALELEVSRISFWRGAGVQLANMTDGGEGVVGLRHSDESRKKMSVALKGKKRGPHSDETRKKIGSANSVALKGRKNPEHSARLKGRKHSLEHRSKISAGLKGRQCPQETREKIGAAHRGRSASDEAKRRMSAAHIGKKPDDATRVKMSAAGKARWSSPEARRQQGEAVKLALSAPEMRSKLSAIGKARFASPEARSKLREDTRRWWARQRSRT